MQKNKEVGETRNSGIKISKGLFISFLDADDVWENIKLEKVHEYLKKNDCDVVCHNEYKIDNSNYYDKQLSFLK